MPRIAEADRLEFAARARSLFISGATVEWFLESATPGQLEACSSMLARELESRERSKRARLLRQARFPVHKTLEGFDWSNVGFPDGWGRDEMLSLGFAAAAEDLVLHGPTGRGKTHVATALGIEATARGIPVRFYQTASLVLQLGKAKREGTLDRLMAEIGRCGLVVLDEFGYVPFDVDGARLPYQVIADSYERRSIVFTTNIEFGGGAPCSPTTSSPRRSWTAWSTTEGSWSSAAPAIGWSTPSCSGRGDAHEREAGDGLAGGPRPGGGDRGDGQVPGARRMEGDQLGRVDRRGRGLPLPGDLRGGDRLRLPGPVEGAAGGASGPPRQAPRGGGFGLPVGRADGRRGGRGSPPRGPYHFGKFSLTKSESSFYHFGNFYLTKYTGRPERRGLPLAEVLGVLEQREPEALDPLGGVRRDGNGCTTLARRFISRFARS